MKIILSRFAKIGEFFSLLSEGNVVVTAPGWSYYFNVRKSETTCDVKRVRTGSQSPEIVGENMSVNAITSVINDLIRDTKGDITFAKGIRISPSLRP